MASCPSCGRPPARPGPRCLYCGAPLAATAELPAGAAAAPAETRAADRLLVILDLAQAAAETLRQALQLGAYDAAQLARRGGLHLHRLADPAPARAEAQRLGEAGLVPLLVPESEARTPPVRALAGEWTGAGLALQTQAAPLLLLPGSLRLVVTGEVVREYLPRYERRREATRAGQRFLVHLHRRGFSAAVEIDPAVLGVDGSLTGSGRLEVEAWIEALAGDAPRDDRFRLLAPALAAAEPDPAQSAVAAAAALVQGRDRRGEPRQLLDNLAQFRFYSGWRGAVERRRLALG